MTERFNGRIGSINRIKCTNLLITTKPFVISMKHK